MITVCTGVRCAAGHPQVTRLRRYTVILRSRSSTVDLSSNVVVGHGSVADVAYAHGRGSSRPAAGVLAQ